MRHPSWVILLACASTMLVIWLSRYERDRTKLVLFARNSLTSVSAVFHSDSDVLPQQKYCTEGDLQAGHWITRRQFQSYGQLVQAFSYLVRGENTGSIPFSTSTVEFIDATLLRACPHWHVIMMKGSIEYLTSIECSTLQHPSISQKHRTVQYSLLTGKSIIEDYYGVAQA
jgi:hypothetical protein